MSSPNDFLVVSVIIQPTGTKTLTKDKGLFFKTRHANSPGQAASPATTSGQSPSVTTDAATGSSPSAATSSPVASSPTTTPAPGAQITSGELAGAVIGTAVGVAIIAFLAAFLLLRRRMARDDEHSSRRRHSIRPSKSGFSAGRTSEKGNDGSNGGGYPWAAYLGDPADDATISRDLGTLFDQIDVHVQNYYQRARGAAVPARAMVALNTSHLPGPMHELLSNNTLTLDVIKHVIASTLLSHILPSDESTPTLLPAYLSLSAHKVSDNTISSSERAAAQQAYATWKSLTAYLHSSTQSISDSRNETGGAAEALDRLFADAFAPWEKKTDGLSLQQHRRSIIEKARNTGILLMSQPSNFDFDWTGNATRPSFVIFPALLKTADESGRLLSQPQVILSPVLSEF